MSIVLVLAYCMSLAEREYQPLEFKNGIDQLLWYTIVLLWAGGLQLYPARPAGRTEMDLTQGKTGKVLTCTTLQYKALHTVIWTLCI